MSAPRGTSDAEARILAQQKEILAALSNLIKSQNSALQMIQKQKGSLSYP